MAAREVIGSDLPPVYRDSNTALAADTTTPALYRGEMVLFHGGVPGLRVGQWILPPAVTGGKSADQYATYDPGVYDPALVYMVTELEQARMFAAMCPTGSGPGRGGDVYRVQPTIPVALDPDCRKEGTSWCASRALILGIVATGVRVAPYKRALVESTLRRKRNERWGL